MVYQVPNFLMGQAANVDFSPVQNALAQWNKNLQFNAKQAQDQEQFQATNALARAQYGIQREAADRSAAEDARLGQQRTDTTNWLARGVEGVPQPLVEMSRISGNADPVRDYIIAEAKRKAEGQFGKQGAAYYDPATGRSYTIQFGSNGERRILPVETGDNVALNPDRGVKTVDTGTGTRVIDATRGRDVREIPKDIAGRERAEEIGKAGGKAAADLPRIIDNADMTLKLIDEVVNHKGLDKNFGVMGVLPNLPGSEAADAWSRIEQLRGRVFLEAFNSLRGGGAITEAEGSKATDAYARLQRAQSAKAAREALKDLREVVEIGKRRARTMAGLGAETSQPAEVSRPLPRVKSAEEARQLPSGTRFVAPDGRILEVP